MPSIRGSAWSVCLISLPTRIQSTGHLSANGSGVIIATNKHVHYRTYSVHELYINSVQQSVCMQCICLHILFVEQVEGHRALVFAVAYKRIKGLREGKSAADREHWSDTLSTDYNQCISVCIARLDTNPMLISSVSLNFKLEIRQ